MLLSWGPGGPRAVTVTLTVNSGVALVGAGYTTLTIGGASTAAH